MPRRSLLARPRRAAVTKVNKKMEGFATKLVKLLIRALDLSAGDKVLMDG